MSIDLSYPNIMGILNVTPDSFSDGGLFIDPAVAQKRIETMIAEGVHIIDIGGESTGPGSEHISEKEELNRVAPIIDYIHNNKLTEKAFFSIDTYKAAVAQYALKKGFQIVNDVTALRGDAGMLDILKQYNPYIVLMYAKDSTPRTSTEIIEYDDVIQTIKTFLQERIDLLLRVGYQKEKIIIDSGMGMFVSADKKYSFEIIDRLQELQTLGCPICVGISRKSFIRKDIKDKDAASVEWSIKAIKNGASIIRIHNVSLLRTSLSSFSGDFL